MAFNNAGIMQARPTKSAQGWDLTFATNYLGPFALTEAFAPRLPDRANIVFYQFTYGMRCPVRRPILDRLGLKATLVNRAMLNVAASGSLQIHPASPTQRCIASDRMSERKSSAIPLRVTLSRAYQLIPSDRSGAPQKAPVTSRFWRKAAVHGHVRSSADDRQNPDEKTLRAIALVAGRPPNHLGAAFDLVVSGDDVAGSHRGSKSYWCRA
jgi:hypothetical protein